MSTTAIVHPPTIQYAGDDWVLGATLLSADGQPLSLLDETLEWTLADKGALNQVVASTNVTIVIDDMANGRATIIVPSEVTERIPGGHYYDALRTVDTMGMKRTLWTGMIHVSHTGFTAAAQASVMPVGVRFSGSIGLIANGAIA